MGTSTSSKGGGAGSPFDPEWLDAAGGDSSSEVAGSDGQGDSNGDVPTADDETGTSSADSQGDFAPSRRFAPARSSLATAISGGGRESIRSAAKHMVNKGMGGPKRAASTMRRTSQGAGQLGQFLAAVRDGVDPRVVDWVQKVRDSNLSANDLVLELVREVMPDTGSIDEESLRNSAAEALGKLYESSEDLDIFNLTNEQIAEVMGLTIANEVCNRVDLQLGQTYERLKFDPHQVQVFRNDVREYIHGEVRVVMSKLDVRQAVPQRLAQDVLESTLRVFAE
jgi:hypothetical protein